MITDGNKVLVIIKVLHTLIWMFFVFVFLYIFYAVLICKIDIYLWICISLICFEGLILMINKWECPLTSVAAKYSQNQEDGFSIFLPKWLAKRNKKIFAMLFMIEMSILSFKLLM